jgi:hypothetical protein
VGYFRSAEWKEQETADVASRAARRRRTRVILFGRS